MPSPPCSTATASPEPQGEAPASAPAPAAAPPPTDADEPCERCFSRWAVALLFLALCSASAAAGGGGPALSLARLASPPPRTLVLLRTHSPTAAMMQRACSLAAEAASAPAASSRTDWAVLFSTPSRAEWAPPYPCDVAVHVVGPDEVAAAMGGRDEMEQRRLQPGPPPFPGSTWVVPAALAEMALYHARSQLLGGYDHVWVLEQDVAWQGNLFYFTSAFRRTPGDLLCDRVRLVSDLPPAEAAAAAWPAAAGGGGGGGGGVVGGGLEVEPPGVWWRVHGAGWPAGDTAAARARVKCNVMAVRYSVPLLASLAGALLARGDWGYEEWWAATACQVELRGGGGGGGGGGWRGVQPCRVTDLTGPQATAEQRALFRADRWDIGRPRFAAEPRPSVVGGDGVRRAWEHNASAPTQLWHPMKF